MDGQRREPGSDQCPGEAGTPMLRGGVRHREHSLAACESGGEPSWIIRRAVRGHNRHPVPTTELGDGVEAPQSSTRVEREEPVDLYPEDAHVPSTGRITSATSSPSTKIRCQISR